MLNSDDIEKLRCPKGLMFFNKKWKREIFRDKEQRRLAQSKKGIYKFFRDEVIPLEVFARRRYPNRFRVIPIHGNQGFDAEVYDDKGDLFEKIELTYPHDGKECALSTRNLHERGYGNIRVYSIGENVDLLVPFIEKTASDKSLKDYGDCVLVFIIDFDLPFPEFKKAYVDRVRELGLKISHINFQAKEVCFLVMPYKDLYYYQANKLLKKDHKKHGCANVAF